MSSARHSYRLVVPCEDLHLHPKNEISAWHSALHDLPTMDLEPHVGEECILSP
jgi:hypothetical protein